MNRKFVSCLEKITIFSGIHENLLKEEKNLKKNSKIFHKKIDLSDNRL